MWVPLNAAIVLLLATEVYSSPPSKKPTTSECKAWPNTPSWPGSKKWGELQKQVEGRLERVIPPGAVCHQTFEGIKTYNATACAAYQANYGVQETHLNNPVGIYWDFWTNRTCVPTDDNTLPCTYGTYPRFVLKAENVKDVQAGVNFARENNIRLLIKNTGHDFMGKSIGPGSLSIWTHQFKEFELINNYKKVDPKSRYTGSAVKLGAGWTGGEIYKRLEEVGKTVVGGECATVGFSGGFIQGGGHGPLSTILGMGTDSVLQYTLVTAAGKYITADERQNSDLFWALRGGGGASWGVVISVTVKTHDTPPVAGASIDIRGNGIDDDNFWAALDAFHANTPAWTDEGIYGYYEIFGPSLSIQPLLAPHKTKDEMAELVAPFIARLEELGVEYTYNLTWFPTFLQGYEALFAGEGAGQTMLTSSRLIQRQNVETNNTAVTAAFRNVVEKGFVIVSHFLAPGRFGGVKPETSVNPAWKDGLLLPLYNWVWNGTETREQQWDVIRMTLNEVDQPLKDVSPGSGTYINEANIFEPNWQNDFYGASYPRLLEIKKKVDPTGVFWAKTAVGSEFWDEVEGRLCKAA